MPKPNTMDDWIDEFLENFAEEYGELELGSFTKAQYLEETKLLVEEAKALITAKLKEVDGCPCLLVKPCSSNCSCANSVMSGGCMRCCKYGSKEQRIKAAQRLVEVDRAARTSERDRIFAAMRHVQWLGKDVNSKEIMKVRKEWDKTAAKHVASLKGGDV